MRRRVTATSIVALLVLSACSDSADDGPPVLDRIDGPAQVDPSFDPMQVDPPPVSDDDG